MHLSANELTIYVDKKIVTDYMKYDTKCMGERRFQTNQQKHLM